MINLHCHTYFSDGILGPAELLTRCIKKRYRAVALTDHIDESNFENVLKNVKKVTDEFNKSLNFRAFCGVELTYVLFKNIDKIAKEC
ncbi:MAG TPA: PHP domain-containing protein, partial [bacterium]|nr:PHP domain-containing protein [bacterium]